MSPASAPAAPHSALLEGHDQPYDDDAIDARIRGLLALYQGCFEDDMRAAAVVELTRRSFWAHLSLLVWTHDEKSSTFRVKPFAPLACYKTLADFLDERDPQNADYWAHPVFCSDKSRQLMMSWFAVARLDWCAIHWQHAYCPIISKNEDDAKTLLSRVETIHRHYPRWYRRMLGLERTRVMSTLVDYAHNEARIEALAQGSGNAIRSRVPTMVLYDEAAFQDRFESNWTAAKGGCDARTQLMAISTANASHFQALVEDHLDGRRGSRAETYHESQGLSIWRNRNNGVDVARIHYTADPGRRSEAWRRQARRGMAMHQWRQEQEIDYAARGGRPIFHMLDRSVHVTEGRIEIVPLGPEAQHGWALRVEGYVDPWGEPILRPVKLLRAIDHGTTNYCAAVWVAVDDDLDWFVYRVYKRTGWFAPENAAAIARLSYCEEAGIYERYAVNVIDAMQGLPDKRGKVEDIYRGYTDPMGRRPLSTVEAVRKGSGSRQEGLDMIATMLHSTLAVCGPDNAYWELEGYDAEHRDSFRAYSSLYLARGAAEPLFEELEQARWDEPKHGDPLLAHPETSLDMMDDCIDCTRYLVKAGMGRLLRQLRAA